jgi:hypothetical protein
MNIDVSALGIGEVSEIAARLGRLNMHSCFSIKNGRALLVVPSANSPNKDERDFVAW